VKNPVAAVMASILSSITVGKIYMVVDEEDKSFDAEDEALMISVSDQLSLVMAILGISFKDTAASYIGMFSQDMPNFIMIVILILVIFTTSTAARYVATRVKPIEVNPLFNAAAIVGSVALCVVISPYSLIIIGASILLHQLDANQGLFLLPLMIIPLVA
jgi:hypothetical protein